MLTAVAAAVVAAVVRYAREPYGVVSPGLPLRWSTWSRLGEAWGRSDTSQPGPSLATIRCGTVDMRAYAPAASTSACDVRVALAVCECVQRGPARAGDAGNGTAGVG